MRRTTALLLLLLAATTALAQFSYDAKKPLDPKLVDRDFFDNDKILMQNITFAGPKGGRIPAYLFKQFDATAAPAVIYMHWGLGDRDEFWDEGLELARNGAEALLLEAPFNRENASKDPNADLVQAVMEARRGVDLMLARKDVDPNKIAFVGHSYGAHVGAILAQVEPRIKAFVLTGGLASNSDAEKNSSLARYDAEKWISKPHAAPVFLQFARADEYVSQEQADRFIKAAGENTIFKRYDGDHAFNASARNDRINWLAAHLGFKVPGTMYQPMSPAPGGADIGRIGVVFEMPGMQQVRVRREIAFKPDMRMDVYYPPGLQQGERVPAIIAVNGQSPNAQFQRTMRYARFATTFAQALAVRSGRIVVVPDIRSESMGDPAADLTDLMKYLTSKALDLQIDATQMGMIARSAGYSYALRAATPSAIKALAVWYGNLGDPKIQSVLRKDIPTLVVTAQHDFWYDQFAAKKFVDATGAQQIHLPDSDHGFEIWDDFQDSRYAFVKTATFFHDHLPVKK